MNQVFSSLAVFVALIAASPTPPANVFRDVKPVALFLAGDSTTAPQVLPDSGGGWGNGLLSTLKGNSIGTNFGHNGATTLSFVKGGDWANVCASVDKYVNKDFDVYVTIAFGHNDQKNTSGVDLEQYQANLVSMARDILALGGNPIMVSPLPRRKYNSSGLIIQDLAQQAAIELAVAKSLNVTGINLNAAANAYLNAIGKANAILYNLAPSDFTHLNAAGSVVFGNLVAVLMTEVKGVVGASLRTALAPRADVVAAIAKGSFILPNTTSLGEI